MFYRSLLWLHRYTGITLGVLVVLATATGSLAVFAPELDRWLNPELFRVAAAERRDDVPLERFTGRALASYPEHPDDFEPAFATLRLPRDEDESAQLLMIDSFQEPHGPWWQAYGDPATGELLGARDAQNSLPGVLIALHVGLMQGEHSTGTLLIGVGGLLTLAFAFTGIYLWWPGLRRFASGFKVTTRSGSRKFWLDLHKVSGIAILLPLVVVTITGLFYVWPQYSRVPLEQALEIPRPPPGAPSAFVAGAGRIPVDQAIAAAARAFPEARATHVTIPFGESGSYTVRKRFAGDLDRQYQNGSAVVWVDQYSGEVLKTYDERSEPVLTWTFRQGIFPLHSGEILGLPGRWLAFVTGLLPLGLFVSGLYCWWKMRARRRSGPRTAADSYRQAWE